MSHPPGTPDPDGPSDPWATPKIPYPQPTYEQPIYPPGYGQPYTQPGGYPPYGPYGYLQATNGKATAALWTGIAAIVMTFCCGLGILGVVPIVLGAKARGEIRRTGGQQSGEGMALGGIIMGAFAVLFSLVVIGLIVFVLATADTSFDTSGGTST